MSRRVRDQELEAGSDSFLDIIANIVGILIILIVIAGVKVSRQALVPPAVEAVTGVMAEVQAAEVSAAPADPIEPDPAESAIAPLPQAVTPPMPDGTQATVPPRVVADDTLTDTESRLAELSQTTQSLREELQRESQQAVARSAEVDGKMVEVTRAKAMLASLRAEVDQEREAAVRMRTALAKIDQEQVSVEQIEHKVTPVGVDVSGREVHYRLLEGRVAFIPIDALIEDLKTDAARQQRWLLQNPRYRGLVGPIRGFRMKYELVKRRQSLAEDLRYGAGSFRVSVSEWEVEPTRGLEEETLEQATRRDSRFARQILSLGADTNVTFWVYPDSYNEFRTLQKLVHAQGLTVAGRPLPLGVPIAGSPSGSRSSGQ